MDICELDAMATPARVVFFRPLVESGISGISVLWNLPNVHTHGIEHFESGWMPEDDLHTGALGFEQRYIGKTLMTALEGNVYKSTHPNEPDRFEEGVDTMRADMKEYYKLEKTIDLEHKLSEVKKLTIGMINGENLSAMGGESRGLVRFAYNMAMRFAGDAPNLVLLAAAGRSLLSMHEILRNEPRVVKYNARQALMTAYLNFVNNYVAVDGAMVYKFHCGCHMIQEIKFFGNCRATATWEDEAENGQDCEIAKTCSAITFAQSVFQKIVAGEREHREVIEVDD